MNKILKFFIVSAITTSFIACDNNYIDPITEVESGNDAAAPLITITSPSGSIIIPFTDTTTDFNFQYKVVDDIEIANVDVFLDGVKLSSTNSFLDYRIFDNSFKKNLGLGSHTFMVNATDLAGKTSTKSVTFNIDNKYTALYSGEKMFVPFVSGNVYTNLLTGQNPTVIGTPSTVSDGKSGAAYKGNTKATEFVLVVTEKFPASANLFVIADTLRDREGNVYSGDFTSVTYGSMPDTTKPKLFKTIPPGGSNKADFLNQDFYFFFDDAFNREDVKTGISFTDTLGRGVKFNTLFPDDASLVVTPSQKLEPQKDYIIKIDLSKFKDAAGNGYDSVYQYKFKTINGLDFTGVTGSILNAYFSKNPVLVLDGTGREKKTYKKPVNKNNFSFERVEAGKYFLWCFYDADSSGTYSYGSSNPFQPSEEFLFYSDTLNLKPRWTVTDVNFILEERR